MKKIFFSGLLFWGYLQADNWGIIEKIDGQNKIIIVNQSKLKILPFTQIEEEVCLENGFHSMDIPRTFKDLKVGQVVELDFFGTEDNILLVEDIEIKCANRAY